MKITPNQITTIRIILLPFIAFFYLADFIPWNKFIAFILFIIAALTDFVDGRLARKTGQTSDLGSFLDTIADKLLITVALLLVIADGTIIAPWGVIVAMIIICREFAVTFLRQIAVKKGIVLSADKFGKYKALFQDIALPAFILYAFFKDYGVLSGTFADIYMIFCYVMIFAATILTILSAIHYFTKNWYVFKDNKK